METFHPLHFLPHFQAFVLRVRLNKSGLGRFLSV